MIQNQTYTDAVKTIKEAILRSQYRAASSANKEQLSLYYGIDNGRCPRRGEGAGRFPKYTWGYIRRGCR